MNRQAKQVPYRTIPPKVSDEVWVWGGVVLMAVVLMMGHTAISENTGGEFSFILLFIIYPANVFDNLRHSTQAAHKGTKTKATLTCTDLGMRKMFLIKGNTNS